MSNGPPRRVCRAPGRHWVPADLLIGRSPAMQEVYKAIGRVAPRDLPVLILGESGTGKELVAMAIYQHSRRSDGPFLAINRAAIPESLLESELFGHEGGAFTGADRRRIGKFEQCSGGTLFLGEIGDVTPLTHTKVLRVLQDGRFERFGPEMGKEVVRVAEAMEALARHPWPGNIRELQGVLEQSLLRVQGPVLALDFLPASVRGGEEPAGSAPAPLPLDWDGFLDNRLRSGSQDLYAEALALMERSLLTRVLRHTGGNQVQAARTLGITRGSLRTKIRTLGIQIGRAVWSGDDQAGR